MYPKIRSAAALFAIALVAIALCALPAIAGGAPDVPDKIGVHDKGPFLENAECAVSAQTPDPVPDVIWLLAAGVAGMAFLVTDNEFKKTKALPNGAASVTSDAFDLGHGTSGDFLANCELEITAPALVVGDLANGDTMTYIVEHDDAAGFGTVATLIDKAIVQTGAGGAGAAAASKTLRLPVDVKRYIRVKATNSGAGDASDKSMTVQLRF